MGEVQPKNTTAERILKRRAEEEAALKAREDAVSLFKQTIILNFLNGFAFLQLTAIMVYR